MKIKKEEYHNILKFLVEKRYAGEEFVGFIDDSFPVGKEDLFTFIREQDAQEFCFEMSLDKNEYDYFAIRSVYRTMAEALTDELLMIERNGVVDVGMMVSMRYERLVNEQFFNNINNVKMNQKNFEDVRDKVKFTGFGEDHEKEIKQKMELGEPKFVIKHETQYGKDKVTVELNFSKSKKEDIYFFNSYEVNLWKEGSQEPMKQLFYINNKGNSINLKEAYNLMEGRAVYKTLTAKDGHKYGAWLEMDFTKMNKYGNYEIKPYHDRYGYDIEAVIAKRPIKGLDNEESRSGLLYSLKKGNLQFVNYEINGKEEPRYIAANPRFKTLKEYDANKDPISERNSKKENQSQSESNTVQQDSKKENQTVEQDDEPEKPGQSNKRRRRRSQTVS